MIIFKKLVLSIILFSPIVFSSGTYEGTSCEDNIFLQPKKEWKVATFAGGCFWCVQEALDKVPGVEHTWVGFTGGDKKDPTYREVTAGNTGHFEAVQVFYTTTFEKVLDAFWKNINPLDDGGQFVDRGGSYKTAIFYHDSDQKKEAEISLKKLEMLPQFKGKKIVTPILPALDFYKAENYHQKYYKCSPLKYKRYKNGSGRVEFIERFWK